jgi:hypothetical protein
MNLMSWTHPPYAPILRRLDSGKSITSIVNVGIGGSGLGPVRPSSRTRQARSRHALCLQHSWEVAQASRRPGLSEDDIITGEAVTRWNVADLLEVAGVDRDGDREERVRVRCAVIDKGHGVGSRRGIEVDGNP